MRYRRVVGLLQALALPLAVLCAAGPFDLLLMPQLDYVTQYQTEIMCFGAPIHHGSLVLDEVGFEKRLGMIQLVDLPLEVLDSIVKKLDWKSAARLAIACPALFTELAALHALSVGKGAEFSRLWASKANVPRSLYLQYVYSSKIAGYLAAYNVSQHSSLALNWLAAKYAGKNLLRLVTYAIARFSNKQAPTPLIARVIQDADVACEWVLMLVRQRKIHQVSILKGYWPDDVYVSVLERMFYDAPQVIKRIQPRQMSSIAIERYMRTRRAPLSRRDLVELVIRCPGTMLWRAINLALERQRVDIVAWLSIFLPYIPTEDTDWRIFVRAQGLRTINMYKHVCVQYVPVWALPAFLDRAEWQYPMLFGHIVGRLIGTANSTPSIAFVEALLTSETIAKKYMKDMLQAWGPTILLLAYYRKSQYDVFDAVNLENIILPLVIQGTSFVDAALLAIDHQLYFTAAMLQLQLGLNADQVSWPAIDWNEEPETLDQVWKEFKKVVCIPDVYLVAKGAIMLVISHSTNIPKHYCALIERSLTQFNCAATNLTYGELRC